MNDSQTMPQKEDDENAAQNMEMIQFALSLVVTPSCSVAGAVTNVFNIVVFAAEGLSQGNNSTLFIISVVDLLASLFSTFAFSDYYYAAQVSKEGYTYRWITRLWYIPLYALKQASLLLSAKVVVGRYIVIKWPFLYRRLHFSMRLSVASDIFIGLIGCTTIIWFLGYQAQLIVTPASNRTVYNNNSTGSDGTVTIQAVQGLTEESYGFEDKYILEEKIAWFYVSDSVRLIALIVVSACGADMVVELRKHSARLYNMTARSDISESVSVSTVSVSSTIISTTTSGTTHNIAQKAVPNFLSIAERRTTRIALGTAILFMSSMAVSMVQFACTIYCNILYDCRYNSSFVAVGLVYILNQMHGFSFPLIYTFSFFLYYTMNKRFKIRFLRIFCRCYFGSKLT